MHYFNLRFGVKIGLLLVAPALAAALTGLATDTAALLIATIISLVSFTPGALLRSLLPGLLTAVVYVVARFAPLDTLQQVLFLLTTCALSGWLQTRLRTPAGALLLILAILVLLGPAPPSLVPVNNGIAFALALAYGYALGRLVKPGESEEGRLRPAALHLSLFFILLLCACIAFGLAIILLFDPPYGYWIPVTMAALLRPSSRGSILTSLQRIAGTVAGTWITLVVTYFSPNHAAILVIAALSLLLALSALRQSHALFIAFLTPTVLLLSTPATGYSEAIELRLFYTLATAALVVLLALGSTRLLAYRAEKSDRQPPP